MDTSIVFFEGCNECATIWILLYLRAGTVLFFLPLLVKAPGQLAAVRFLFPRAVIFIILSLSQKVKAIYSGGDS